MNRAYLLSTRLMVALLLTGVTACNSIVETDVKTVTNARVVVTGTSTVPLLLVTSFNFGAARNPETTELLVSLVDADTISITVPFDRTFPFSGSDRMHVRLINADPNVTAAIRMQLLVDGKEFFNQQANMRDAMLTYTFFNFPF